LKNLRKSGIITQDRVISNAKGGIDMVSKYNVSFFWDDEAKVWIATSEDVRGLVLEDESLDRLMQRVFVAIPDFLEEAPYPERQISINCIASRNELVCA